MADDHYVASYSDVKEFGRIRASATDAERQQLWQQLADAVAARVPPASTPITQSGDARIRVCIESMQISHDMILYNLCTTVSAYRRVSVDSAEAYEAARDAVLARLPETCRQFILQHTANIIAYDERLRAICEWAARFVDILQEVRRERVKTTTEDTSPPEPTSTTQTLSQLQECEHGTVVQLPNVAGYYMVIRYRTGAYQVLQFPAENQYICDLIPVVRCTATGWEVAPYNNKYLLSQAPTTLCHPIDCRNTGRPGQQWDPHDLRTQITSAEPMAVHVIDVPEGAVIGLGSRFWQRGSVQADGYVHIIPVVRQGTAGTRWRRHSTCHGVRTPAQGLCDIYAPPGHVDVFERECPTTVILADCAHGTVVQVNTGTYRVYRGECYANERLRLSNHMVLQACLWKTTGWWDDHDGSRIIVTDQTVRCRVIDNSNVGYADEVWPRTLKSEKETT